VKKHVISRLFLYRYRFYIGYILLALAFMNLIFLLPTLSPDGLSSAELSSVTTSYNLHFTSVTSGDLVDLPYHLLQKFLLLIFGFSTYVIKLPSILIAVVLGLLLVLLLNRWFKSNVALLSSVLTILSVPFLYLAGSGTPLIMLVFWPTFLLWLGSKIQGVKKPRPFYCLVFAIALLLSVFTPHMIYLDIFIVLYALANPHLRFTIKTLPRVPFILTSLVVLAGLGLLATNIISDPNVGLHLLTSENYESGHFLDNIKTSLGFFFSWGNAIEGVYLTPLISIASLFLAFAGLFSTAKGFFASRNAIASYLVVFTVILSGFSPDSALLIILPLAILTAHGLRYILEKWYGLFPENPYARVFGIFPIFIFISIMIISGLSHYIFGYRYTPVIANEFNNDLDLVIENLDEDTTLLMKEDSTAYGFYECYEDRTHAISVGSKLSDVETPKLATFENAYHPDNGWTLSRIITSSKTDNSGRIFVYTVTSN